MSTAPLTDSCPCCLATLVPGARFCSACGARVADGVTPTFPAPDADAGAGAGSPPPQTARPSTGRLRNGADPGGAAGTAGAGGASLGVGQEFGPRYLILKVLGAGGMGAVYQAWDKELSVAVALKVIRPEVMADPDGARDLERRFKRELLLARQVTHKHVVRIHDLGEVDGIKYITMPYVEGEDLATTLRREGKLPVPRVLRLARQVASGLRAAHEAGVVHRDLKPANVMLEADDNALLMDFGIALSAAPTTRAAPGTAAPGSASPTTSSGAAPGERRGTAPGISTGSTVATSPSGIMRPRSGHLAASLDSIDQGATMAVAPEVTRGVTTPAGTVEPDATIAVDRGTPDRTSHEASEPDATTLPALDVTVGATPTPTRLAAAESTTRATLDATVLVDADATMRSASGAAVAAERDATMPGGPDATAIAAPLTGASPPPKVKTTSGGTILSTRSGGIVGTLEYMSPEQSKGEAVDLRADIYAFGLILADLLTGPRRLAPGTTPWQAMLTRVAHPPTSLREKVPEIPEAVDALVAKCLQVNPDERFQTTGELVAALDRLDDDGNLIPEPEVRRLTKKGAAAAAALVAGLMGGTYWLARTPPQATELPPVSVLIASFENQANDPVFDGLIEQALGVGIETASFIVNYPQRDALRAAAQLPGGRLTLDNARLISLRENVNVVLAGGIAREGDAFKITLRAIQPSIEQEQTLFATEATAATRDDVLAAVARIAARVRTELGDTTVEGGSLRENETFTAGSLEAAQAYTQGQEQFAAGRFADAIEAYQRAVQLDPNLGRAWSGLGAASSNLGRQEEARRYYEEALARIDRMTDREKFRTRGGYFLLTRNAVKAKEEYGALVNAFPADATGWANLALSAFLERDMTRALELGQRGSAIFPRNVLRKNNVALYAMYAGDFETAEKAAREVLALNPEFAKAHLAIAMSQLATGKPDEANATYTRLGELTGPNRSLGPLGLADAALYQGRPADAASVLEAAINADREAKSAALPRLIVTLAEARVAQGRSAEAVQLAEEAARDSRDLGVLVMAARVLIGANRVPQALDLAKALDRPLEPEALAAARLIEGEAAMAGGLASAALAKLQEAQKLANSWLVRFALARTYLSLGAFAEASSELDVVMKRQGEATAVFLDDVPTYRYLPPAIYYRALAQEGLRSPAARESYAAFLAIRNDGNAVDPLVSDARRRLAALQ